MSSAAGDCEVEPPLTEMAPEEEEEEPHNSFTSTSATCATTLQCRTAVECLRSHRCNRLELVSSVSATRILRPPGAALESSVQNWRVSYRSWPSDGAASEHLLVQHQVRLQLACPSSTKITVQSSRCMGFGDGDFCLIVVCQRSASGFSYVAIQEDVGEHGDLPAPGNACCTNFPLRMQGGEAHSIFQAGVAARGNSQNFILLAAGQRVFGRINDE